MKQAIGYVRVSTEAQASEGVSIDSQKAKIEAWAIANDYKVSKIHVDAGISGFRADNRPALQEAIKEACEGKSPLVVYSLSRLARSTTDAISISRALEKCGADLVSLTERIDTTSASGKMVFRMMAVLAEFERDQISERTKSALTFMKAEGKRVGTIPFGHALAEDGKSLVTVNKEQKVLKSLRLMLTSGKSLRQMANELNARGVKAKLGGKWHPEVVRRVLAGQKNKTVP